MASTTTISWTGLGLGLITEIGAGGPGAVIYGFILVTMLQCFLGASLAEFVSSYPTEGGMYHWIAAVAPKKMTGVLSFFTGWFSVLGCMFRNLPIVDQTCVVLIKSRDFHHGVHKYHLRSSRDGFDSSLSRDARD